MIDHKPPDTEAEKLNNIEILKEKRLYIKKLEAENAALLKELEGLRVVTKILRKIGKDFMPIELWEGLPKPRPRR